MNDAPAGPPRLLVNTSRVVETSDRDAWGALWRHDVADRDLDANVIALPPDGRIERHWGPDVDVLIHVLAGRGRLDTDGGAFEIRVGDLVSLPRRSARAVTAGPEGLRYLTVHRRRQALVVQPPPTAGD